MQVTDIIQTIGIIVTLAIAIWQMRVQSRQVQASADLALMLKFDDINKLFIEHPGLWKLLEEEEYEPGHSEDDLEKVENVIYIVFNTLELAYRHYSKHALMRNEDWAAWELTLDAYLRKKYVAGWWSTNHSEYSPKFEHYVKSRVKKLAYATVALGVVYKF